MSTNSRIGDVLIQQGLLYFVLTLVANLIITILTILKLSPTMSLIAAIPQSTICVIASTRLYSQLAKEATSKGNIVSNNGNHQTSSSSTFGSFSTSKLTSKLRRNTPSFLRASPNLNSNANLDLEKASDFNDGTASPTSVVKKASMDDVLETQSSAAVRSYQQHTTNLESSSHPFSNLAVLDYHDSQLLLTLPRITRQVDDDEVVDPQIKSSEDLAAKYPNLFRKES